MCQVAILWDTVQRQLFYNCLDSESLLFQIDFNWNDGALRRTRLRFYVFNFLKQKPLTNGAVVPFPSRAALTLAVLALPVLGTVRVAGPFFTAGSHPALFTLAYPSGADTVAATVQGTQLCTEKQKYTVWNSTSYCN